MVKTKIAKRVGFHARNTTLIFFTLKMFYRTAINNYIKSGRLMVLDSGDVVSVINEDESLDYLRVETCGDSLWINKQNVTEAY